MATAEKTAETVNSYISDMLSLEEHISKALQAQLKDLKDYPEVTRELESIQATVGSHVSALETLVEQRGGGGASPVKRVGSKLLGLAAGAVDLVRTESLPKDLRDDYAALSLATIGYVMLHTTALSLGEDAVGDLAHRHLRDYAPVIIRLHNLIPSAVIRFLKDEGLPASDSRLDEIARNIESVWRDHSGEIPRADQVPGAAAGQG